MKTATYAQTAAVERRHWWFRARGEIVQAFLKKYLPKDQSLKILDIGCGTGGDYEILKPFGTVTGVDAFPEAVEFCKSQGWQNVSVDDATNLHIADNTFDVTCCLDVLNGIQDDAKAVQEALRVTKPGGTLLFTVAAYKSLWGQTDIASQHVRRYSWDEFLPLFKKQPNCKLVWYTAINTILFPFFWLSRKVERKKSDGEINGLEVPATLINEILFQVFRSDKWMVSQIASRVGVSYLLVAKKI